MKTYQIDIYKRKIKSNTLGNYNATYTTNSHQRVDITMGGCYGGASIRLLMTGTTSARYSFVTNRYPSSSDLENVWALQMLPTDSYYANMVYNHFSCRFALCYQDGVLYPMASEWCTDSKCAPGTTLCKSLTSFAAATFCCFDHDKMWVFSCFFLWDHRLLPRHCDW